jgi:hypothetical protein
MPQRDGHANTTDLAKRERAAIDVLALLPDRWRVGPTSFDPGTRRWSVTARGPHPGRGKYPETIAGTGEDELAAMIDLRLRLDERQRAERLDAIDRRGRAAFLEGAEAQSMSAQGRLLTVEEQRRVMKRYPG